MKNALRGYIPFVQMQRYYFWATKPYITASVNFHVQFPMILISLLLDGVRKESSIFMELA